MLKVKVQVPAKRDRAGFVEIVDGFSALSEGVAVATSGFAAKGRGASHDHPPLGRYELTARAPTPGGAETEYGPQVLLFEPIGGPALEAESYGRFSVLLYAGSAGSDALLRRTQGGVRLSRRAMEVLLAHVRDDTEIQLEIETLTPPPWWAFWRKRKTPPLLSRDPPRHTAPPYDEATIAAQMLQSAIRRDRKSRREDFNDRDRWRDRDRDSTSSSSRESGGEFRGGGGSGGGGGASGGWTDAPAAGRGPGVNAAGVIAGAAGVAAIAAAAAEKGSASNTDNSSAEPSGSFDSSSATSDSGTSGTTTSTAY